MKTKNKPELSAEDKKTLADYASKYAALGESLTRLRKKNDAQKTEYEQALDAWDTFREELRSRGKDVTNEEDAKLRRLYDSFKQAAAVRDTFKPAIARFQAARNKLVHAAATIVAETLLSGKYAAAKMGEKTCEKFTADAAPLLSAFGDFRLYYHTGHQFFSEECPRIEITISESGRYSRFESVASRYGRKAGERIFPEPNPPKADTEEKIFAAIAAVEKAKEDFQEVQAAFEKWKATHAAALKLTSEEYRFFNCEIKKPEFAFGLK
ncbi:MAG: hypothetical protein IKW49_01730 [Opitutales bacterium]|nr:hypothetical protein [Opitutales bacterium]